MKKDEIKIYCKYNNTKQTIEQIISKIFIDYLETKDKKKEVKNLNEK